MDIFTLANATLKAPVVKRKDKIKMILVLTGHIPQVTFKGLLTLGIGKSLDDLIQILGGEYHPDTLEAAEVGNISVSNFYMMRKVPFYMQDDWLDDAIKTSDDEFCNLIESEFGRK